MKTYIFFGKVLPERANVNITPIKIPFNTEGANFQGEATISIFKQLEFKFIQIKNPL